MSTVNGDALFAESYIGEMKIEFLFFVCLIILRLEMCCFVRQVIPQFITIGKLKTLHNKN